MAKKQLGLYVTTEPSGDYFHVKARVVELHTEKHGSVLNPNSSAWSDSKGLYLADLEVYSQGNSRHYDGRVETDRKLYGFDVVFKPHTVDGRKARAMAKTLTTVERKLAKLNDSRGYVASFGEYVTRVAEAVGAKTVVQHRRDNGTGRWGYDGSEHRFLTLGEGRRYVEQLEQEWKDQAKPKVDALDVVQA